jgi:hypothetical protein
MTSTAAAASSNPMSASPPGETSATSASSPKRSSVSNERIEMTPPSLLSSTTGTTEGTPTSVRSSMSGTDGGGIDQSSSLPFELTRNMNTEWLMETDARHRGKLTPLLLIYIFIVLTGQGCNMILFTPAISWTVTNIIHGFITMTYLHWIKGSPNNFDISGAGEMNGMTLWEQLYNPALLNGEYNRFTDSKLVLIMVPTCLSYAGCLFSGYDKLCCLLNIIVWVSCIVAKMPFMHGVRLLGINRTVGIDDYAGKKRL